MKPLVHGMMMNRGRLCLNERRVQYSIYAVKTFIIYRNKMGLMRYLDIFRSNEFSFSEIA